jgi:hypothetical protein
MSMSYTADQIAARMDQEGCAGCAETFLLAVASNDMATAVACVRESISHIETEGYNDDYAVAATEALEAWLSEVEV